MLISLISHLYIADGVKCETVQPRWKRIQQFLPKLNMHLSLDLAISLLGIYLVKLKFYIHIKTCTQMILAALFLTVPKWKKTNVLQQMNS